MGGGGIDETHSRRRGRANRIFTPWRGPYHAGPEYVLPRPPGSQSCQAILSLANTLWKLIECFLSRRSHLCSRVALLSVSRVMCLGEVCAWVVVVGGERGWVCTGRDAGVISDVRLWPGDKHWLADSVEGRGVRLKMAST